MTSRLKAIVAASVATLLGAVMAAAAVVVAPTVALAAPTDCATSTPLFDPPVTSTASDRLYTSPVAIPTGDAGPVPDAAAPGSRVRGSYSETRIVPLEITPEVCDALAIRGGYTVTPSVNLGRANITLEGVNRGASVPALIAGLEALPTGGSLAIGTPDVATLSITLDTRRLADGPVSVDLTNAIPGVTFVDSAVTGGFVQAAEGIHYGTFTNGTSFRAEGTGSSLTVTADALDLASAPRSIESTSNVEWTGFGEDGSQYPVRILLSALSDAQAWPEVEDFAFSAPLPAGDVVNDINGAAVPVGSLTRVNGGEFDPTGWTVEGRGDVASRYSPSTWSLYPAADGEALETQWRWRSIDDDALFSAWATVTAPAAVVEPPVTEPPVTEPPVVEPPVTEPPVTEPPVVEPPVTEPPVVEPPVTEPPVSEPPVVEPPATEPPVAAPPVTEPPVVQPPAAEPPANDPLAATPSAPQVPERITTGDGLPVGFLVGFALVTLGTAAFPLLSRFARR